MLQISRILACEFGFTVSSLESLNEKIEDYLQGVSNILPQMLQKVKTHLSVHVVSVIYLYHIPSSYTVVHHAPSVNMFSSETTGPIFTKFGM